MIVRIAPELGSAICASRSSALLRPNRLERVYVLSRVTLGADVAVTSVMLDAAKRRYPRR